MQADETETLIHRYLLGMPGEGGTDPDTGLATAAMFHHYLRAQWRSGRHSMTRVGLVMVAVDGFEDCLAASGADEASRLLHWVAILLDRALMQAADLPAHYAAGTLAVVLPGAEPEAALRLGERVCRTVGDSGIPLPALGEGRKLTVSAGTASLVPGSLSDPRDLEGLALTALQCAAALGGNQARSAV